MYTDQRHSQLTQHSTDRAHTLARNPRRLQGQLPQLGHQDVMEMSVGDQATYSQSISNWSRPTGEVRTWSKRTRSCTIGANAYVSAALRP
jgi:hypothetical protein